MESTVFFRAKSLMEMWYLLITEKFLFWTFQRWEIRPFFSQKVHRKMIFTDYWKVLVLNFSVMGNIYKVDGQMIFTLSFWAFHDIPGLGKYGFSCSDILHEKVKLCIFKSTISFFENLTGSRVLLRSRSSQGILKYHKSYGLTIFHKINTLTGVLIPNLAVYFINEHLRGKFLLRNLYCDRKKVLQKV